MTDTYKSLCKAVAEGNKRLVNILLKDNKVDPNQSGSGKRKSILRLACRHTNSCKNLDIVKLLITNTFHPADPNEAGKDGITPFIVAVKRQSIKLTQLLLTECLVPVNVNYKSRRTTALMESVSVGNGPMVQMLLNAGADPNLRCAHLPLQLAICCGYVDICKILVDNGSEINTSIEGCRPHCTAIHVAAGCGNLLIVQYLLAQGADIFNLKSTSELISMVVMEDRADILEYCLQYTYNKLGDNINYWRVALLRDALVFSARRCVSVLLCWGIYTCPQSTVDIEGKRRFNINRTLSTLADDADGIDSIKMMIELNPQCLQERWLVEQLVPHKASLEELIEARKHPPQLIHLCRAKVFQQLGYNPIPKAEKLPLPRMLKDFVKFKDILGVQM